ncbi:MAG: hypothetical protein RI988_321 [Pseudomonadota bacterium]|jgi:hypothetical protein
MKPAEPAERTNPEWDGHTDALGPVLEAQLRKTAARDAEALAADAAFHAAVMARLAGIGSAAGAQAHPQPGAAAGMTAPEVWLAMPVGMLLALGLWLSAGLMGNLEWMTAWPMPGIAQVQADGAAWESLLGPALQGLGGAVVATWTAWVAWQARRWLLGEPFGVD